MIIKEAFDPVMQQLYYLLDDNTVIQEDAINRIQRENKYRPQYNITDIELKENQWVNTMYTLQKQLAIAIL